MSTADTKKIFKEGKFYVVDEKNSCLEFNSFYEAKRCTLEGEVMLICVNPFSNRDTQKRIVSLPSVKADKIIIDFDKNELTVKGREVILLNKLYKVGVNVLSGNYDWEELSDSATKASLSVEIIGHPPLKENEEDITYEMSDL